MSLSLILLIVALFVSACTPATPVLPAMATATPTPTPVLAATPTPTPVPEATGRPTHAAGTPTATPVLTAMQIYTSSATSPDMRWIAQAITAFPVDGPGNYYTQLKILRADGAVTWTVVDRWARWGLGYTIPQPFAWSSDGRYLYFTNRPVPDGCGIFVNGSDLHKISLSDGSVTQVAPPLGLWLSLSPDERTLAYRGWGDRGLVLRDLVTGTEREAKLRPEQDYAAGHILWAPDGSAIVLTLAVRPCSAGRWTESTSVVRVEVDTLQQTTLLHEDRRLFITMEWPRPDRIRLKDGDGRYWWMEARTGQVTKE